MPVLLHLDSSADLEGSVSRSLTARLAAAWTAAGPEHLVVRRDLHVEPLPHLENHLLHWAPRLRPPGPPPSARAEDRQRRLLAELGAADALVIGAPMYNWSLPSTLKAWVDHVHVPGTSAPFDTPTQPFAGTPVVVVTSRGGRYGPGTEDPDGDHEVPALRQVLGTALGMDVTVVVAELTLAAEVPALRHLRAEAGASLERARAQVDALGAELAARSR